MRVDARWRGIDRLDRELSRVADMARRDRVLDALEAGAEPLAEAARLNAGRISRRVARSIVVERRRDSVAVGPTREGFIGHFFEWGTSKMAARPWLRPAVDSEERDVVRTVARALGGR